MKRYITLLIVLILLGIAFYLYYSNNKGTLGKELKDFAVEDTSSVNKIFLVDKSNNQVSLTRHEGYWMVNNKYEVRKDAIDILLKTIKRIQVKSTIPKASHNTVIKNLAGKSTKVEIYIDDKCAKTYYVGYPTQDQQGTYMLIENSKEPFITHIPGFNGYLSTRYFTDENLWRANTIFKYKFNEIKSISLINVNYPEKSFEVFNYGNNNYGLKSLAANKMVPYFDTLMVKDYISYFKKVNYETPVNTISKQKKDSILKSKPTYIITLTDIYSKSKTIKTYLKKYEESTSNLLKNKDGILVSDGNPIEYDTDRMYTFLDNNKFMVTIQYYVFDPLLLELDQFLINKNQGNKK